MVIVIVCFCFHIVTELKACKAVKLYVKFQLDWMMGRGPNLIYKHTYGMSNFIKTTGKYNNTY